MAVNGICVKCDAEFRFPRYADLQPHERITCTYCRNQMRKAEAEAAREARNEGKRQRRYRKWRLRHPPLWLKLWRRTNPFAIVIASALLTLLWTPSGRDPEERDVLVKILYAAWIAAAVIVSKYFENLGSDCRKRSTVYWRANRYLASCCMRALSFALFFAAAAWPLKASEERHR